MRLFHENTETPAAKVYKNPDGIDTMFCFTERRVYRASDFIKYKLINSRMESVFYRVWEQLNDKQKQYLIDSYSGCIEGSVDFSKLDEPSLQFKKGQIDITQFREYILDLLK